MHEWGAALYGDWVSFVTQIDKLQDKPPDEAAVNLDGVQEREPEPSVLALRAQMCHVVWRSEDNLVRDDVPMLEVVQRPVFSHREDVAVPVEVRVCGGVDHPVLAHQVLED